MSLTSILKNKRLWKFFLLVFLVVIVADIANSLLNDICSGGIGEFENRHCGMEGRVINSRVSYNSYLDVTLQPTVLFMPSVFNATRIYDDSEYYFRSIFSQSLSGYPLYITPWFSYDIFTYQTRPTFIGSVLPIFLWLLNIPYWILLAWAAMRLWDWNKIGKAIVILAVLDKLWWLTLFLIPR